jgi:hypothetical protein
MILVPASCGHPLCRMLAVSPSQVCSHVLQQFFHGLALVVSCHVGMQFSPDATLDLIVIGTVRRQEIKAA